MQQVDRLAAQQRMVVGEVTTAAGQADATQAGPSGLKQSSARSRVQSVKLAHSGNLGAGGGVGGRCVWLLAFGWVGGAGG
ncbi:MAG: hypothetical protein WD250_09800 [Egibacteraceae bacterium]